MKLFEAAWDDDVEQMKYLLQVGVSVDIARPVCKDHTILLIYCLQCMHNNMCIQDILFNIPY